MKNYTNPAKKKRLNRLYVWIFRKILAKIDFVSISKTSDSKQYVVTFWNPKTKTSLWLNDNPEDSKLEIRTITHY